MSNLNPAGKNKLRYGIVGAILVLTSLMWQHWLGAVTFLIGLIAVFAASNMSSY